jgi:hypothetical protein
MKLKILNDYAHLQDELESLNFRIDDNMAVCEVLTERTLWSTLTSLKKLGINNVIVTGLQEVKVAASKPAIPSDKKYVKKVWCDGAGQWKVALDASGQPILQDMPTNETLSEVPRLTREQDKERVLANRQKHNVTEDDFQEAGWIREIKKIRKTLMPWEGLRGW